MSLIHEFAAEHRVRIRITSTGEYLICGRPRDAVRPEDRNHVFENGDGRLGVCLLLGSVKRWNNAKRYLLAEGFELHQDGETEGTLLFDPDDPCQADAAIRAAGIARRKNVSAETLAAATLRLNRMEAL